MPSIPPKTRLTIGLACALGFVFLLAIVSLRSSQGFARSSRDVGAVHDTIDLLDQTEEILSGADDLLVQVLDKRVAADGFNLSIERNRFAAHIVRLDVDLGAIPGARAHIHRLSELGYRKLVANAEILDLTRRYGIESPLVQTKRADGLRLTSQIENESNLLREFLLQRLKQVSSESEETRQDARAWMEGGLGVAAIVAVLAAAMAVKDFVRRIDAENDLQNVVALQEAIFAWASTSIIATDVNGTITVFNRQSERMLGYSASEMIGKATPAILHDPEEVAERAAKINSEEGTQYSNGFSLFTRHAAVEGHPGEEWTYVRKDGTRFPAHLVVRQVLDRGGKLLGYVGLSTDLTERQNTQAILDAYVKEIESKNRLAKLQNQELQRNAQQLKESRDDALAATRMKSEFLANMSHEIRTPMNGVIGMTHLLLGTPLNEKQLAYARTVQQSAEGLLLILNDILDLSKMEAGKMTLETFPFDLRLLIEDLCDTLASTAHAKRLELNCVFPPVAPTQVMGDPGRLRQVLTNLVGNAIKFTERGEVTVSVRVLKENQKRVNFRFSVADTGIGISEDRHDRIFDSFTQADGSTTRKFGGTGLGLTICRQLMVLMGGEIGLKSSPGEGSEFWVEMAFQKQPAAVVEQIAAAENLVGIRVLVADDNATNRFILREMLTSWNCRLTEAADGREALGAISLSSNDPFACVIMDMHMPGMDGLDAARAIKSDPRHKDLPLILLSSSGFAPTDPESTALFAAVLSKPVRSSPLFNAMSLVTGISKEAEPKPEEPVAPENKPLEGVSVLVVEDNPVNQLVVTELLQVWGCKVVVADNGAIAVVRTAEAKFDVILMDVQMPVMDGFEATAAIRAQEELSGVHTDIIAMTANAMSGDKERCLRAGMDSYLSKPLQPSLLLERLAAAAGRSLLGSGLVKVRSVVEPTSFDVDRLNASCSGNDVLKLKVIDRYMATSLNSLAQISQAVASGDGNAAKSAAHALKGSSLTIGAKRVGEICEELEVVAALPGFGREMLPLAEDLNATLLAVHEELKAYAGRVGQNEG